MPVNKKRVLFVITQAEQGGAQRWVFDMITSLNKEKYECLAAAGCKDKNQYLPAKLGGYGIRFFCIKNLIRNINPFKDFLGVIELFKIIKKERPDILQLCSTKAGFLGSIAGRLAGAPLIIYRIGGWAFNDPRPNWKNKIFFWIEKLTAPLKDKIVVNSQHDYDQALKLKICPLKKLFLIYNGIEINKVPNFEIRNLKFEINIGCIANFYSTKGLVYLIEAFNLLNLKLKTYNLKLIIIGEGPQRSLLEKLIIKCRLENIVALAGQKNNPWQYFSEKSDVDIFVIPSVKEGLPYVLLEAMSAGLPIIATTAGGIPEIIKDRESGLIVPIKNPQKLAEAMELLIKNPDLRKKLAKRAKEEIKKLPLKKMVGEFEMVYERTS